MEWLQPHCDPELDMQKKMDGWMFQSMDREQKASYQREMTSKYADLKSAEL